MSCKAQPDLIVYVSSLNLGIHLFAFSVLATLVFVVAQSLSCVDSLWPMDCSMSGFPVLHYLPEFAQVQVHWVMMLSYFTSLISV